MIQQTTTAQGSISWAIDQPAIAAQIGWGKRQPNALQADLQGMAQFFPHWLLVGTHSGRVARCAACRAPAVPTQGAFRCVECRSEIAISGIAWIGQIPALSRPEPRFQSGREALAAAGFAEVTIAQQTYLLVPLIVHYPAEWPNQEPVVHYNLGWLKALNLPASNAHYHLISNGRACIYGYNQWFAQPIHAVLGQRMLNHIASLFKIVAGQSAVQAFIGRIHNDEWTPDAAGEAK